MELAVGDNGGGFPPDFRWEDSPFPWSSQVVRTLIHQLRATLRVANSDGGVEFRFSLGCYG